MKTPIPDHAIRIWLAGDEIHMAFDSPESAPHHTIKIPIGKCSIETTEWGSPLSRQLGWYSLMSILKSAEQAGRKGQIAEASAPSSYQLEQMLRAMGHKAKVEDIGKVDGSQLTLADLDL